MKTLRLTDSRLPLGSYPLSLDHVNMIELCLGTIVEAGTIVEPRKGKRRVGH